MFFLFILFQLVAIGYILTQSRRPYPLSWLVKATPILILLVIAALELEGWLQIMIVLALLFSAGGDIALEWDRERLFILGLALFLIGHLFYVAGFLLTFSLSGWPLWVIPIVLLFALVIARQLWPKLGRMRGPVIAYIIVIVSMSVTALLRANGSLLVVTGAITFMVSDALIALDKFDKPIPGANYYIMGTYYLAQGMIVAGLV